MVMMVFRFDKKTMVIDYLETTLSETACLDHVRYILYYGHTHTGMVTGTLYLSLYHCCCVGVWTWGTTYRIRLY